MALGVLPLRERRRTAMGATISIISNTPGEFYLEIAGDDGVLAWQFRRGSSTYRFLTEEVAMDSTLAAHLLRRAGERASADVDLTVQQWQRLRRLSARPPAALRTGCDRFAWLCPSPRTD